MQEYKGKKADITIDEYGAMTGVVFHGTNRDIHPLFEKGFDHTSDEFMMHMKGGFFATPFGSDPADWSVFPEQWRCLEDTFDPEDNWAHGYGCHHIWKKEKDVDHGLCVSIEYPENSIVKKVVRTAVADETICRVTVTDEIEIRKGGEIQLGIHPIFMLTEEEQQIRLTLPAYEKARTYPIMQDTSSLFVMDQWVDPEAVPLMDGGCVDATLLPMPLHSENLLMLCNVTDPVLHFNNKKDGYTVKLTWNNDELKNCLLWYSNRGRKFEPWNGTNLCLGVEPITAAFDLGDIISRGENPLKKEGVTTGRPVQAGETVTLCHTFELEEE